jgi:hypothetical protein
MRSVTIISRDKKEFHTAFSLLIEFGKERNLLTLNDDDDISFAFLMKEKNDSVEDPVKVSAKKSDR